MKPPEQMSLAFETDVPAPMSVPQSPSSAVVLSFCDAHRRQEARRQNEIYDRIIASVQHIDITRGRRMAEARERATYTL